MIDFELEPQVLKQTRMYHMAAQQMMRPIYALHHPARELSPEASAFVGLLADARCGVQERPASPGSRSPATSWGFGS